MPVPDHLQFFIDPNRCMAIPRIFIFIAQAAWLVTFLGLLRVLLIAIRGRGSGSSNCVNHSHAQERIS